MIVLARTSTDCPLVRQPSTILATQTFREVPAKLGPCSTTSEPSRDIRQAPSYFTHTHPLRELRELQNLIYILPEKEDRLETHRLFSRQAIGASKFRLEVC